MLLLSWIAMKVTLTTSIEVDLAGVVVDVVVVVVSRGNELPAGVER